MFSKQELYERIAQAMPDATIDIQDLTGGQDHYQATIVSSAFAGLSPIARHRAVYALFTDVMGGALHALSLTTRVPGE